MLICEPNRARSAIFPQVLGSDEHSDSLNRRNEDVCPSCRCVAHPIRHGPSLNFHDSQFRRKWCFADPGWQMAARRLESVSAGGVRPGDLRLTRPAWVRHTSTVRAAAVHAPHVGGSALSQLRGDDQLRSLCAGRVAVCHPGERSRLRPRLFVCGANPLDLDEHREATTVVDHTP